MRAHQTSLHESQTDLEQRSQCKDVALVVLDIATRAVSKPYSYEVPTNLKDEVDVGCAVLVSFGRRRALGYVVGFMSFAAYEAVCEAQNREMMQSRSQLERNAAHDEEQDDRAHATPHQEVLFAEVPAPLSDGQDTGDTADGATRFYRQETDIQDSARTDVRSRRLKPLERVLSIPAFDHDAYAVAQFIAERYACTELDALKLFLPPGAQTSLVKDTKTGVWTLKSAQVGPVDDRWASLTESGQSYTPAQRAIKQRHVLDALQQGPQRVAELATLIPGSSAVIKTLEKKGVVSIENRRRIREIEQSTLSSAFSKKRAENELTQGQKDALATLKEALDRKSGDVIVLDGVTGSGKTEVYLNIIDECLSRGKGAFVLVPEISLTPQTVGRFRGRFGDRVAVLHSKLSVGERFDQWDLVRDQTAQVVVGARSALFAPLKNPGIIVIDEEHEYTYKQGSTPRYHARDVAAFMARQKGCPVVLGSATPSLEVLYRCEHPEIIANQNHYLKVEMNERVNSQPLPETHIVDMGAEFASGHRSMFSRQLTEALHGVVDKNEKSVLLLNRRGFAHFLLCRECGYVPRCEQCSTSLTYHAHTHQLMCHTCGATYPVPSRCPKCQSPYLKAFGTGTQRVEDELNALLENSIPIIRMDADTTRTKGGHEKALEAFDSAPSAILLGTQMIAKGLDFPEVTLAGVINADTVLKMPDFRSAERTYSLLEQIAGRAGRGIKTGQVIIQTYWPEHPALRAVAEHDRSLLIASEYAQRQEALYPPYVQLGRVLVWGSQLEKVKQRASEIGQALRTIPGSSLKVLGPVPCLIEKAKNNYRYHVVVKADHDCALGLLLSGVLTDLGTAPLVNCAIDIDPYDLM